jgi:hypothetical protein
MKNGQPTINLIKSLAFDKNLKSLKKASEIRLKLPPKAPLNNL